MPSLPISSLASAALTVACLLAVEALGGEFWLEPSRFQVGLGTTVHIHRVVGNDFQGTAWRGKSNRLLQQLHIAPGQAPINLLPTAAATDTLATTITFREAGTHLIALATTETLTTLPAVEFNTYLQKEGLEHVLALREQRKETNTPGREAYQRCATTLVQVGPALSTDTSRTWARPAGLPLELVPEQNPYLPSIGGALTVRVLANGRPVAGQQVVLWRRGATPRPLLSKLRSNQNGRVLFRISGPGEYLISTVRMTAAPAGQEPHWQSTWSTLSFGIPNQKHR